MNPREIEDKYGTEVFWEFIDKGGLKFWSEMPWMKGGKKLWSYLKGKENVAILSAPARRLPNSPKGKKIWVKRELGNVPLILKRARKKQQYANEHSILIDDYQKNIKQWEQSGGIGIWHKTPEQTIKKLKAILEKEEK